MREWLDEELKKSPATARDDVEQTLFLASLGTLMKRLGEVELANLIDDGLLHWNTEQDQNMEQNSRTDVNEHCPRS